MNIFERAFISFGSKGYLKWMSDEAYLKAVYKIRTGKKLDLKNPQTFNEKLQWIKIHNRKPEYTAMVDKYGVKKLVAEKIGEEYIIKTLGVWDSFDEIDFDSLPDRFVLKCTHDSGGLVICRDKSKLDIAKAKEKIERSLKRNYFWSSREWPYKDVKPRIIAEEYMEDSSRPEGESLLVYKIMNFGGEPKIIQTIQNDKKPNESIDYFDTDWNLLELRQNFPNSTSPLQKPTVLSDMLELSRKMSAGFPFLRVDFYVIEGKIYFSEYTFFSDSGLAAFTPPEWDKKLGDMIKLPKVD
ncbi:MAG: glycosyl transferase [Clostridia bacterium]|nr:glycosyl transferase [Clostridia bacterium]